MLRVFEGLRRTVQLMHLRFTVFWVTSLISMNSIFTQQRMSHENGIAARGSLRVVPEPTFPPNGFFEPGWETPCRVRFGAATWKDDAKLVIRGAALKFADTRFEAPLDILMNTGRLAIFWDARTFVQFIKGTMAGRGKAWVPYLKAHPMAAEGGRRSMTRTPTSVGSLEYNTKTCLGLVDDDGRYHYVRYRLAPLSYERDGEPTTNDLVHPWLQNPLPDETRGRNYLKDELRARLATEPIEFMLRMQARPKPPGSDPEWVTAQYGWDDTEHPWHDVARVTIDEALDYEESQLTWFSMSNHPDCLPVPLGVSMDDPHSLNNLRIASHWARRARLLSYRLRGLPKAFGDSRSDPDWVSLPPMPDPP